MAIHEEVLEAAIRICRARGGWTFRVDEIVRALPHLNKSSVSTHIVSRCCVNAPKNHPHKWNYFRRVDRGEYEVLPPYRRQQTPQKRVPSGPQSGAVKENVPAYEKVRDLHDTIHAVVRRSAEIYVGECLEVAVVTQGRSLDELVANLQEAIQLHLEGESLETLGLSESPRIAITYEEPILRDAEA